MAATRPVHPAWAVLVSPTLLAGVILFVLALAPRWARYDMAYATIDEALWMRSAGSFAYAINHGQFDQTFQSGHPGVLAAELAIIGQGLGVAERFGDPLTGAVFDRDVTGVPGYFDALVHSKRAVAVASSAAVVAIALIAWRLLGPTPALVGGVLLTLEPYHLAKSQQITTDAALSACMVLALLCGLMRWGRDGGRHWAVAGGVFSGLALLAKVVAAYLGPFILVLALALGLRRGPRALVLDLAVWGTAGLVTFVALWPSMWVDPLNTLVRVIEFAVYKGGRPHASGNFFLGEAVADPGAWYYPVATLLRLGPATTVALLALLVLGWRERRVLGPERWRLVLALLAFVLGFGLFMTLGAKKLNPYVLPILPVLDLLAGVGTWLALRAISRWGNSRSSALPLVGMAALAVWPLVTQFPHYLAYYNPLLGGGQVAARTMLIGEGEGLDKVARWLNARPDAASLTVAAHFADVLQSTFVGKAVELRSQVPRTANYVVLYGPDNQIRRSQRVAADYGGQRPKYVVRLNGIEYARVYGGPALDEPKS